MKFHPLAALFPLLPDDALQALADDISANGQRQPITLYQDSILDGRNRFRACELAGVEPLFEEYDGDRPLEFVIGLNLHRRHLTESQRAMVAGRLANMGRGSNQHTKQASIEACFVCWFEPLPIFASRPATMALWLSVRCRR